MSKSRKAKERRELFGGALCGFVNAQTTDEAYFPILTGIQNISGSRFSSSFIEKVKEVFPSIGDITPPPKDLKEEFYEISSHEKRVLPALSEVLEPLTLKCDRSDHSLVIAVPAFKVEDFLKLPRWKQEPFLRAMRNPMARSSTSQQFYPYREMQAVIYPETYEVKLDIIMPDYEKSGMNESEVEKLLKQQHDLQKGWTRFNTIVLHKRIQAQQNSVRKILDALISEKPLTKDISFYEYVELYNKMPRFIIEIDQQDILNLKERYPILEEDYLRINLPLKWLDRIKSDLAYCLIEFLLSGYQKDLKRCAVCSKFLVHPSRKRCPGECTQIAQKESDKDYKRFLRWEEFVDDVKKEKCKTDDDLYRNPRLMRRARSFRFGPEGAIERLKASKVLKSDS